MFTMVASSKMAAIITVLYCFLYNAKTVRMVTTDWVTTTGGIVSTVCMASTSKF
jgi:hypothetical protein